jgi:hypothetical protein
LGVGQDFLATTALAILAGIAAENTELKTWANTSIDLPRNVIIAVREGAGFDHAPRGQFEVVKDIQADALQKAANLNAGRGRTVETTRVDLLPAYNLPSRCDQRLQCEARGHAFRVTQEPLFWLEAPGARELRNGFRSSFDRSLLVTDSRGEMIRRLVAARPDREERRLAGLLAQLSYGGHIDIPARSKELPRTMAQPRMRLVSLTDATSFQQAIVSDRPDVRTMVDSCVLLAARPSVELPPDLGVAMVADSAWRQMVTGLIEVRGRYAPFPFTPFPSFYEALQGWHRRLQKLADDVPKHLRRQLTAFGQLPFRLAALFLQIHPDGYKTWEQQAGAAEAAIEISEWLGRGNIALRR